MTGKPELQTERAPLAIRASEVTWGYRAEGRRVDVLGPLTLAVEQDEFVSIIGPPAAGKSTLLRLLAGLDQPGSGEIELRGRNPDGYNARLGVALQDSGLMPWRTVLDNVLLPAEIRSRDAARSKSRARELLASMGLGGCGNHWPSRLSEEQRRRAVICRAFLDDPCVVLLDDPLGGLDALAQEQIAADLQRLWMSEPRTLVLVTKNLFHAVQLSDRVLAMAQAPGRIVGEIGIDLPRPRRLDKATTPQIAEQVNCVRTILRAQGILP